MTADWPHREKSAAAPLALCWVALIAYASLFPFTGWRNQGLMPWVYLSEALPQYWTRFDVLANFAGYAPLGLLLALAWSASGRLPPWLAALLATLAAADIIACEDTRHSRRLLDACGIDRPLLPLHQHNERGAAQALLQRLQEGANVALVSDAGTPLVSDPGAVLTRLAHEAGIRVCPIPGASSVIAALSASGLPADRFQFAGFIPAKAGERQRFFAEFATATQTTVFFETPHRIAESLAAMAEAFDGARRLVVARELTKQFEQIAMLTVASAPVWLAEDDNRQRGEFVLLLEAATKQEAADWQPLVEDLRAAGLSAKDTAALVAKHTGANKKAVYQYLVGLAETGG